MKKLRNKIKAHFSGWPEAAEERIVEKKEEIIKKSVKESQARKAKKPKGLNSKKKKKARKQGNIG